jgi:ammonium transporter, Amt family
VGITAGCFTITGGWSIVVGLAAGILCVEGVLLIDKLKIDDPVGAITVHGVCGIFGTLAVGLVGYSNAATGEEPIGLLVGGGASQLGVQALGTFASVAFAFVVAGIIWLAMKYLVPGGVRVSEAHELEGLDIAECGVEAYNEELKGFHSGVGGMSAAPAE